MRRHALGGRVGEVGRLTRCVGRGANTEGTTSSPWWRPASPSPTAQRPTSHCAAENIQIHGGIGFTWEHHAHLYFKRAKSSEMLLANLTTIGQIGVTYNASLEQVLVLEPPFISTIQAALPRNNATGIPTGGEFAATVGDPNPCTVGFLPPSQWRSPADTTTVDTPDGLYCKLPQDSPSAVRGARNYPCMGHPGKRAATVQICDSDKPFEPLALRQHILGPNPLDPNLISQGIPPDQRINHGDQNIFGPVEGTSLPPSGVPPPALPARQPAPPVLPDPPIPMDVPDDNHTAPTTSPSSLHTNNLGAPAVGFAIYNPRTGNYLGPDGHLYSQADLAEPTAEKSWKDLLLH